MKYFIIGAVCSVVGILTYKGLLHYFPRTPEPLPRIETLSGMTYAIIEGKVVNLTMDSLEVHILREGKAVITHKTMATW